MLSNISLKTRHLEVYGMMEKILEIFIMTSFTMFLKSLHQLREVCFEELPAIFIQLRDTVIWHFK